MEWETFEDIGLTKSESKIYLTLIKQGKNSAGNIANKSNTTSSKIYENLEKLIKKGLITYNTEKGVKVFYANDPKILLTYLDEEEEKIKKRKEKIKTMLPKLQEFMQQDKNINNAKIYRGIKGLKNIFHEILDSVKKDDEFLTFGVPKRSKQVDMFFTSYSNILTQKNVIVKSIFGNLSKNEKQIIKNEKRFQFKFSNQEFASATTIIGDKTIIFPKEITEPILFVIENKDVAQSYKEQFYQLWNKLD
jgi:sugar-specific transcriptional regulator TrmB